LMKRELSEQAMPSNVQVQGARLELQGQRMTVHVNLLLYDRIKARASLTFVVDWQPPNLRIEHESTEAGPWSIPLSYYQAAPTLIPIDQELPPLIAIRDVTFETSEPFVSF